MTRVLTMLAALLLPAVDPHSRRAATSVHGPGQRPGRRALLLAGAALPVSAYAALAQAPALTYADRSGTIAAGGAAQALMPAWAGRHGCVIQNQSAGSLWVSEMATAVTGPPSIMIPAGQQYLCMVPASGQAFSIIGATTAQAFAAREW